MKTKYLFADLETVPFKIGKMKFINVFKNAVISQILFDKELRFYFGNDNPKVEVRNSEISAFFRKINYENKLNSRLLRTNEYQILPTDDEFYFYGNHDVPMRYYKDISNELDILPENMIFFKYDFNREFGDFQLTNYHAIKFKLDKDRHNARELSYYLGDKFKVISIGFDNYRRDSSFIFKFERLQFNILKELNFIYSGIDIPQELLRTLFNILPKENFDGVHSYHWELKRRDMGAFQLTAEIVKIPINFDDITSYIIIYSDLSYFIPPNFGEYLSESIHSRNRLITTLLSITISKI